MACLIAGHSQAKYLHKFVKANCNMHIISRSGYRVEQMWDEIKDIVGDYDMVVLFLGANNLPGDDSDTVIDKLGRLIEKIRQVNSSAHMIISGILPRAQNNFPGNELRREFLNTFNKTAAEVNSILRWLATEYPHVWYVDHPEFFDDDIINRCLLSKDGLHLSFEGTERVFKAISNMISFIKNRKIIATASSSPWRERV